MTTTLIVVRHGNTFEANEMPTRVGASTDVALVDAGREQARHVGQYLKLNGYIPNIVYSAYLSRARETAQIILESMRLERNIEHVHMLNEIDYGTDENQPETAVIERIGRKAMDDWNRLGIVPEGWNANSDEIIQGWYNLASLIEAKNPGKIALVVTSNGVGRFSLSLTGDFQRAARNYGLKISTGGICIFTKEKNEQHWHVKEWNIRPKGH